MHLGRRPPYANITATLALVVATSTSQIKPKVLKNLHGAQGSAGAKGASGSTGPRGRPGLAGVVTASNTIAIECVGGGAGYSAPEETVAQIPMS